MLIRGVSPDCKEIIRKSKYVHLLWQESEIYSPLIVEFVNDSGLFSSDEHCFVTPFKSIYELISGYENVVLAEGTSRTLSVFVNRYEPIIGHLVVHAHCIPKELIFFKRKLLGRTLWRSWGGELLYSLNRQLGLPPNAKNLAKSIINILAKRKIAQLHTLGIANSVDKIYLRDKIGDGIRTAKMPYVNKAQDEALGKLRLKKSSASAERMVVLVGHSGYAKERNIEALEALASFSSECISVRLVLSYGDPSYIEKTRAKAIELFGKKVEVLDKNLPYTDYLTYLNEVDVAVLNGTDSSALGTLELLLRMRKTVYVSSGSLYARAMVDEGLPVRLVEDLPNSTFKEFAKPSIYPCNYLSLDLLPSSTGEAAKRWQVALASLEQGARK